MTEQIERITKYENIFREAKHLIGELSSGCTEGYIEGNTEGYGSNHGANHGANFATLRTLISELEAYYASDVWKQDFADDEAGLLPADLKRGVLSEDGIYNLLEEYSELMGEPESGKPSEKTESGKPSEKTESGKPSEKNESGEPSEKTESGEPAEKAEYPELTAELTDDKGSDDMTEEQYEALFMEMHPGYFERDYVRAVPDDEPASEMMLALIDFDEGAYTKNLDEEVTFGYYEGGLDDLLKAVAKVVPHWTQFFGEDTRVYCGFVNGEIASFCQIEDFGEHQIGDVKWKIGGPGCVGTLPEYRNRGIGLSMVRNVTKILKEESYDHSYIHYTYETAWYSKLGYKTFLQWNGKGPVTAQGKGPEPT
ncbi:Acetyltransferase (GNAT) domain-containing protein [Lachnospiraceae bacterium XBB2008]|nr:Acetyltransferase (GNAT) domain-containing protein [Lachnospiraceae bacterium XBB2008]